MEEISFNLYQEGNGINIYNWRIPRRASDDGYTWMSATIEIKTARFSANFPLQFITLEIEDLEQGFANLANNLKGTFRFGTMERNLELDMKGDGIGHFNIHGVAQYGDQLIFYMQFELTKMIDAAIQLKSIISRFPKGSENGQVEV